MVYIFIAFVFIIAILLVFAFYRLRSIKMRFKKISIYSDEIAINLKNQQVDIYYNNLDNTEIKNLYEELNSKDNSLDHKKDLREFVDIGCRAKFLEDIMIKRGIEIPEWK
jgi:hypothetical protein